MICLLNKLYISKKVCIGLSCGNIVNIIIECYVALIAGIISAYLSL